jgi:hypothetical protein
VVIGEALLKEAERVADRLRIVLPRLLNRQDDTDGRALVGETRATLQRLADAAALAQGRVRRAVPEIGVHAVPDQVLVLAHDLVTGTPEPGTFTTQSAATAAHEGALAAGLTALQELRSRL